MTRINSRFLLLCSFSLGEQLIHIRTPPDFSVLIIVEMVALRPGITPPKVFFFDYTFCMHTSTWVDCCTFCWLRLILSIRGNHTTQKSLLSSLYIYQATQHFLCFEFMHFVCNLGTPPDFFGLIMGWGCLDRCCPGVRHSYTL